jgi:hypothetical protein
MSETNKIIDYETWIAYGQEKNWCSKIACVTHTWLPTSDNEDMQFADDYDPCIYGVRIYENVLQSLEVKETNNNG